MEAVAASIGDLSASLPMADETSLGCAESHQQAEAVIAKCEPLIADFEVTADKKE
jgi:hypothetical protein